MKNTINNLKELNTKDLANVIGGKYYGNGVSCGKKSCSVNWSQAWGCIGNRSSTAISSGAGSASRYTC